jgi:hypothetical protein
MVGDMVMVVVVHEYCIITNSMFITVILEDPVKELNDAT